MEQLTHTSEDKLFNPCMPEVEHPAALATVFDKARAAATRGVRRPDGSTRRCVVVVTPGRLLMLQPCPPPGTMPEEQVSGIRKLLPPEPQRKIVAVSYTEMSALQTSIAKAIPFIGMLLGLAYVGHAVWVFEGHASALALGCRDADVLLVDSGMLPYLPGDWQSVAASSMRRPEIYVHDRRTFQLSRPARPATV